MLVTQAKTKNSKILLRNLKKKERKAILDLLDIMSRGTLVLQVNRNCENMTTYLHTHQPHLTPLGKAQVIVEHLT